MDQTIEEVHCDGAKTTKKTCFVQKCPVWVLEDWTPVNPRRNTREIRYSFVLLFVCFSFQCSVTCGKGFRTKPYYCNGDGRIYSSQDCNPNELPVVKEECVERPCTKWGTGEWSECSSDCGEGVKKRKVTCRSLQEEEMDEKFCGDLLKPNNTKECVQKPCSVIKLSKIRFVVTLLFCFFFFNRKKTCTWLRFASKS